MPWPRPSPLRAGCMFTASPAPRAARRPAARRRCWRGVGGRCRSWPQRGFRRPSRAWRRSGRTKLRYYGSTTGPNNSSSPPPAGPSTRHEGEAIHNTARRTLSHGSGGFSHDRAVCRRDVYKNIARMAHQGPNGRFGGCAAKKSPFFFCRNGPNKPKRPTKNAQNRGYLNGPPQ